MQVKPVFNFVQGIKQEVLQLCLQTCISWLQDLLNFKVTFNKRVHSSVVRALHICCMCPSKTKSTLPQTKCTRSANYPKLWQVHRHNRSGSRWIYALVGICLQQAACGFALRKTSRKPTHTFCSTVYNIDYPEFSHGFVVACLRCAYVVSVLDVAVLEKSLEWHKRTLASK